MLDSMLSLRPGEDLFELAVRLHGRGTRALLVSGGSRIDGQVPLEAHLGNIARIRSELGMKVVVHSGFATAELAAGLAACGVDGVMIDVIGADETLREVYHLDLGVDDVERSLRALCDNGLKVIPHIVAGLHYGRFLGERRALEIVSRYRVSALVLVVLQPLAGTPMVGLPPCSPEEIGKFFAEARLSLPSLKINLGCARPLGAAKVEIDRAAVDLGLNGIAFPAEGTIRYARERGYEPRLAECCCSLAWGEVSGLVPDAILATP
jgi:hypothetical protein